MRARRIVSVLAVGIVSLVAATAASAAHVVINFDSLPDATAVTNQFPPATFSSTPGEVNATSAQDLGSSLPNFICTAPFGPPLIIDCTHETIVSFSTPVSNLSFLGVGIGDTGPVAKLEVTTASGGTSKLKVVGVGSGSTPVFVQIPPTIRSITRLRIYAITDEFGIGWDDFAFDTTAVKKPTPPTPKP